MAGNPKYQYADMDKLRETQKEALEDFASRVSDFAQGTAKEYAAPFANTVGMLFDARAKAIKDLPVPPSGFNAAGYIGVDWKTTNNMNSALLHGAAEKAQGAADRWKQSGTENLERAKQGLAPIIKGGIDVGSQFAKLVGDKTLGAVTKIGATPYLALRTFGDAAQTARQEGATLGQQALYGVGSAISGALLEKAVDGIGKIYGRGRFDDIFKKAIDTVAEQRGWSELQRANAQNGLTAIGEGVETGLGDLISEALKVIYKNDFSEEKDWSKAEKDALIDFIIALILKEK